MNIRILAYNIHKGLNWSGQKYALKLIKDKIRQLNLDLVFLQEIIGENKKLEEKIDEWPKEAQYEYLADEVWHHHAYAKNAIYNEGHHGNAILSKFPIIKNSTLNISTNKFEQRGVLSCEIEIPHSEQILYCHCVHLNLLHGGRKKQYTKMKDLLKPEIDEGKQVILAGDFNDWNKKADTVFTDELGMSEVHKALHGEHAKSFPIHFPFLHLDRIYVRNVKIISANILKGTEWEKCSDHAPLLAEIEIS